MSLISTVKISKFSFHRVTFATGISDMCFFLHARSLVTGVGRGVGGRGGVEVACVGGGVVQEVQRRCRGGMWRWRGGHTCNQCCLSHSKGMLVPPQQGCEMRPHDLLG